MGFPVSTPLTRKEIITPTAAQRHVLGARGEAVNGRIYRYSSAGSSKLIKGRVVQSSIPTSWSGTTLSYVSTAWANDTAISTTWNHIDLTVTKDSDLTVAADVFKDGYLWISGTTTESGQMVRVKSHLAASSNSTSVFTVNFADDEYFSEVVDSGSFVSIQKNEYDSVVIVPAADATGIPLGVPNADVSTTYYFWLQTWGVCPVLIDSVTPTARGLQLTTSLAGGVDSSTATTGANTTDGDKLPMTFIGNMMASRNVDDSYTLVHLTMAP